MAEETVGIELEPLENALQEGWMLFRLTKVWGSVKMNLSGVTRELGNSVEPANGTELRIAIAQHPGVGPQPEDAVSMMEVYDIGRKVLSNIESVIRDIHETQQAEEKGDW